MKNLSLIFYSTSHNCIFQAVGNQIYMQWMSRSVNGIIFLRKRVNIFKNNGSLDSKAKNTSEVSCLKNIELPSVVI